jgi:hypothetical protein
VDVQRGVQTVFRAANERLRSTIERMIAPDPRPVICECSDPNCMQVLELSRDEYEQVRGNGQHVLAKGHETPAIEQVVGRADGYILVRKY